jgi:hypothetical protein
MKEIELYSRDGVLIDKDKIPTIGFPTVVIRHGYVFIKTNENRYQLCDWFQFVDLT